MYYFIQSSLKTYREDSYSPHSTDDETEALKSTAQAPPQTASKQRLRALHPGLSNLGSKPPGDAGSADLSQANE